MLKLEGVKVSFGDIPVLTGVDLEVASGELVALVGSNNSGKSTTLRAVSGLVPMAGGAIIFNGEPIGQMPPHKRAQLGITLVPEGRNLFYNMTVEENIHMGGFLDRKDKAKLKERLDHVLELFPTLKEKLGRKAGQLSGGEQQMVSMGRGMMSSPKLMLIDEPSLGLAPVVVELVIQTIQHLNAEGFSILLVEQNLQIALSVAHRGYVLENGEVALSDTGQALLVNSDVRAKYLGI